ncbi:Zn-dependent oxidoreductase [Occultella glacieicola]|uniref:Zn-dependent oxidoreductase n=1 Tax=Occultella glacieicola TaxID=2518684 RepID=A0ABY2E621_9MICO|nr:zinc-binding dehydrogenase [Occultella glacieicola]TDE96052.1 Zn-dependent oxidoreductase [Occultella glacieicola]
MRCAYAARQDPDDPLSGLEVGDLPEPETPDGWVRVQVRAASLNHHDLWSLRGVGLPADRLPMILGTDAAGATVDGREVIVHSVIASPGWTGEETLDPKRTLLSELHPGTLAEQVHVPARNVIDKPAGWSFAEAACLPTAYLTAYRMLYGAAGVAPGQRVLVQGAGGGVATAAILLARLGGAHVTVTSRDEAKLERARALGAHDAVASGTRIAPVDAVLETVGEATWAHSLRSLRPGGVIAVAGATSGPAPSADLNRVFFRSLRVIGTTMGTLAELAAVRDAMVAGGLRPVIDSTHRFTDDDEGTTAVRTAFERLASGAAYGKVVLTR